MDGMRFTVAIHLHGTLSANATGVFQLPCPASLVEVSAVATNDSDATLQIGTSADADGIVTAAVIGDSSTPVVFAPASFRRGPGRSKECGASGRQYDHGLGVGL